MWGAFIIYGRGGGDGFTWQNSPPPPFPLENTWLKMSPLPLPMTVCRKNCPSLPSRSPPPSPATNNERSLMYSYNSSLIRCYDTYLCTGCDANCPFEKFLDLLEPNIFQGSAEDWRKQCDMENTSNGGDN